MQQSGGQGGNKKEIRRKETVTRGSEGAER